MGRHGLTIGTSYTHACNRRTRPKSIFIISPRTLDSPPIPCSPSPHEVPDGPRPVHRTGLHTLALRLPQLHLRLHQREPTPARQPHHPPMVPPHRPPGKLLLRPARRPLLHPRRRNRQIPQHHRQLTSPPPLPLTRLPPPRRLLLQTLPLNRWLDPRRRLRRPSRIRPPQALPNPHERLRQIPPRPPQSRPIMAGPPAHRRAFTQ